MIVRRSVLGLCGSHLVRAETRPPSFFLGESVPLKTSTSVCLSVQVFRENETTGSLAVWACVVPPSVMQHAVLLGRDSWMRFNSRSYRFLPPRPSDQRVSGELELVHHTPTGMSVYAIDPAASDDGFHLRYEVAAGIAPPDNPQLLAVDLVRSDRWLPGTHWTLLGRHDAPVRPTLG